MQLARVERDLLMCFPSAMRACSTQFMDSVPYLVDTDRSDDRETERVGRKKEK